MKYLFRKCGCCCWLRVRAETAADCAILFVPSTAKLLNQMGCLCSKPKVEKRGISIDLAERETIEKRANQKLTQNVVPEIFGKDIRLYYNIDKGIVLGTGISGGVKLCTHKKTKIQFAVKVRNNYNHYVCLHFPSLILNSNIPIQTLAKANILESSYAKLKEEIRIMAELDHPNILRLQECYETDDNIYLVMELCKGGELLDRLYTQRGNHYTEAMARKYIHTMLNAIRYCHVNKIGELRSFSRLSSDYSSHNCFAVHRDLKLENFLFESERDDSELKLIDFGLSQHFKANEKMTDRVGTPYYVAPEVKIVFNV